MSFEDFFNEQMTKSGNGYDDQIAGYRAAQAEEEKARGALRDTQIKKLEDQQYQAKQDAYVAKRMAERDLPQLMAAQGITGGLTETTASNIYNDWLKAQNKANSAFASASTEVGNAYNTDLASMKTKWAQTIGEAEQNKRNDAFAKAQWAYQAWQAEEERKRQEAEKAAAAARSRGYSSGRGGGGTTPTNTAPTVKGYRSEYDPKTGYSTTYEIYSDGTEKATGKKFVGASSGNLGKTW